MDDVTTAVPSSDTAMAAWTASAPASPAAQPAAPSGEAAKPAGVVEGQPENLSLSDLEAALGVEEPKVDPAKAGEVVPDPLEALKDNPRVMELVAAETTLKSFLGKSEYVKEPAHVEAAIADADVLWQIVDGKMHPGAILEAARQNQTPENFQKIVAGLADYIGKLTGKPIAAPAAGKEVAEDPVAKELASVKESIAKRERAEQQAKFDQRIGVAREAVTAKLTELVKGTFLEGGDAAYLLSQVGAVLPANEQLIKAIESKDFKGLETAFRAVKKAEATRFQDYAKWVIASKKAKAGAIPNQAAGGSPQVQGDEVKPELDAEKRRAQMTAALRA